MNKIFSSYKVGISCAIGYCVPLLFFLKNEQAKNVWILYVGSFVFTTILVIATSIANKKLHYETSITQMVSVGERFAACGILFTIPISICLFLLFDHNIAQTDSLYNNFPELFMMLIMSVVVVNFFMGSFAVLLDALVSKQYPKNMRGEDIT